MTDLLSGLKPLNNQGSSLRKEEQSAFIPPLNLLGKSEAQATENNPTELPPHEIAHALVTTKQASHTHSLPELDLLSGEAVLTALQNAHLENLTRTGKGHHTISQVQKVGQALLTETSDSPQEDIQHLLCFVLQKKSVFLLTHPEHPLSAEEQNQLATLLQRRIKGEPIAYLTQSRGFWKHLFTVSPHVLIPRPETEVLIEIILGLSLPEKACVVDLGTGSGCIAISLALEHPHWDIYAVDKSPLALNIAVKNARHLGAQSIHFIESDWYEALPASLKAHLIVSNPPYIKPQDPHLKNLAYEPQSALVSSKKGLADIEKIILCAPAFLHPKGCLLIEHGYQQKEAVAAIFKAAGYQNIQTYTDLQHHPRVTFGYLPPSPD